VKTNVLFFYFSLQLNLKDNLELIFIHPVPNIVNFFWQHAGENKNSYTLPFFLTHPLGDAKCTRIQRVALELKPVACFGIHTFS
jgi:hypothetical protein